MGKLAVLYFLVALAIRFLYRGNPRVKRRLSTWFVLFAVLLLMLVVPWDASGSALKWVRLATILVLLAYLAHDLRKALTQPDRSPPLGQRRGDRPRMGR